MFEVQSFHDHLGSYQDIDPLLFKLLYQAVVGSLAADAVDIHTGDTGFGEGLFQKFFDAFGPEIPLYETMVAAGSAGMQGRVYGTAIMAMQLIGQFMKAEGDITIPALWDPSADLADLVGGVSPAILKENDLFANGQRLSNSLFELGAENDFAIVPGRAGFVRGIRVAAGGGCAVR